MPDCRRHFRAIAASAQASLGTLSVAGDVTFAEVLATSSRSMQPEDIRCLRLTAPLRSAARPSSWLRRPGTYGRVTIYPVLHATGGLLAPPLPRRRTRSLWPWANSTTGHAPRHSAECGRAPATVRDDDQRCRVRRSVRSTSAGRDRVISWRSAGSSPHWTTSAWAVRSIRLPAISTPRPCNSRPSMAKRRPIWFATNWPRATIETGLRASQRWTWRGGHLWTRVQSGGTSFDTDITHGGEANLFGLDGGIDWSLGDRWLAGGGGGYASGSMTLDGLNGSSDYIAPRGFGYAGYTRDRWAAHGGVSISRAAYSRDRAFQFVARLPDTFGGGPIFGGVSRNTSSEATGLTTEIWGDWETPVRLARWTLRPAASVRSAHYSLQAWRESGADSLSLSAPAQALGSVQAGAGIFIDAVNRPLPADREDNVSPRAY